MIKISPQEAFLIFAKWRESDAHLHVAFFEGGVRTAAPGWIFGFSVTDESVSVLTVSEGFSTKRTIPLTRATFRYEEPQQPSRASEFGEASWAAYLFVELPDGFSALFAERAQSR